MNARELIEKSARLIGLLATGQQMTAEEAEIYLSALNEMLHSWELQGINLSHTDYTLLSDVVLPDNYIRGVRYNLAKEIATEIPLEVPPRVAMVANETYTDILGDISEPATLRVDSGLL